jgi:two-component system, chemotaxis family, chemotaxis protein CheY
VKKVMVVDDSRTIRQQVGTALAQAGYEVVEACDGIDGLEKLEGHDDLALILCDINMPRMSGLEMLSAIVNRSNGSAVPVLMLTSEGRPDLIDRARRSGAKGWIMKPVKLEMLLAAVHRLLGAS